MNGGARLGFPVKAMARPDLKSHDARRWRNTPHLKTSLEFLDAILDHLARGCGSGCTECPPISRPPTRRSGRGASRFGAAAGPARLHWAGRACIQPLERDGPVARDRLPMNWISNYVRPKINSLFSRREVPENLWVKCDSCGTMLFHRELAAAQNVCTNCGHHMAISPRERFKHLFDGGVFVEVDVPKPVQDPLGFRDAKKYGDRLREARRATGAEDAMLVAEGDIARMKVVCVGQDFGFLAGSMGMFVGNAIIAGAERAVKAKAPLVLFAASGGARMQEGILSLMQMPRTTVAVRLLKDAGLPYVVVLTHPTTGGVTASYAMLGDVQIAEPNALICFAGPRVIEQTIRETLPEGFQRAEYLLDHGMLDRVVARKDMRVELARLLRLLVGAPPPAFADLPAPSPEHAAAPAP
jgi:acetyl-CoA carboxylase carboxyl transferase subunit beta